MFVANKALDVGEQCLPFAAVIGGNKRGSKGGDENEVKESYLLTKMKKKKINF